MVEDRGSILEDSGETVHVSGPLAAVDASTLGLDHGECLPAIRGVGRLGGHLPALPHDDVAILGSSDEDSLAGVVRDTVDLVVEELASEDGFSQGQNVVLVGIDVEESNHVLS